MSCKIERGNNGRINKVLDENGVPSSVFNKILNIPTIALEQAIDIYSNIYSEELYSELKGRSEDEVYKVTFNKENDLKSALKDKENTIKVFINDLEVSSFKKDNPILSLVKDGIIKGERVINPDGTITTKTEGHDFAMKAINSLIAKDYITGKLDEKGDLVERYIEKQNKISSSFNTNIKKLGTEGAIKLLAIDSLEKNTNAFGVKNLQEDVIVPTNQKLESTLNKLLEDLGIKKANIKNWKKGFEKRNGNSDIEALASIAEKTIYFADGKNTIENLTEETMHFIVEGLDQNTLKPILDEIHLTDEWNTYASRYMDIYKNEDVVRKEILGKVLANHILLQNSQSTLKGGSILKRLMDIVNDFISFIRNNITETSNKRLEMLKKDVYIKLVNDELIEELNSDNFTGNKLELFSLDSETPLQDKISGLLDKFKKLDSKTGKNYSSDLEDINVDELDELSQLKAITDLSNSINKHTNYLLKRGKNKGFLSTEEEFVYSTTTRVLQPLLIQIKDLIADSEYRMYSKEKEQALAQSEETITTISKLIGALNNEREQKFSEVVDKVALELNLSPEMKDLLRFEIENTHRDTNQFYALYGGIIHAHNPLLNIMSSVVSKMHRQATVDFTERQNNFMDFANKLGFKDEDVASTLKKFYDGDFLLSKFDFKKFDEEVAKAKLAVYNSLATEQATLEEMLENEEDLKAKLTNEDLKKYVRKSYDSIREQGLTIDALTKEGRQSIQDATKDLSDDTLDLLSKLNRKKRAVFARAEKFGSLSEEDLAQLEEIQYDQIQLSNIYNEFGELKKGLSLDSEGNLIELSRGEIDNLDKDTKTSYELTMYSKRRADSFKNSKTDKFSTKFYDTVLSIAKDKGISEAINFLKLNSRINFTEKFWGESNKKESTVDLLRINGSDEALSLADSLEKAKNKLKNILKSHKKYNTPSQISYENLGESSRKEIHDLVSLIENLNQEARNFITKDFEDSPDIVGMEKENAVSEDYLNILKSKKITDEDILEHKLLLENANTPVEIAKAKAAFDRVYSQRLEFILQHVTPDSRRYIKNVITKSEQGLSPIALDKFEETDNDLKKLRYAESKLLPYFREIKPVSFDLDTFLKEAVIADNISEFLEQNDFVNITPAYIFTDAETNDRLNPEFSERRKANDPLINLDYKKGLFVNKRFIDMFGTDSRGNNPTKNLKEFELLQELVKFQEKTIDSARMTDKHNKYLLPQYRQQEYKRIENTVKNASINSAKQWLKDNFTIREDDPLFGQDSDGNTLQGYDKNLLTIPKIGFNKIADEKATDELLFSYMSMAKEAELRKQRLEAIEDIEVIRTKILNQQYGDKAGEATKTYEMFDSFVRSNIFGQRETLKMETDFFGLSNKKHNLTPVLTKFQGWVRMVNLAFNILTPLTSFFQGSVNYQIEKFIGDRIDKDASRLATKKLSKVMTESVSETFNLRGKGELNSILQFMGLENAAERYKNSDYGKAARAMSIDKIGYLSHQLADAPLITQVTLAVLHDFRVVDGKLLNFVDFRNRNRDLTEKEARTKWATNEDKVLYNYFKDGKLEDRFYQEVENGKERLNYVRTRLMAARQEVDNQIPQEDKGYMQRHAAFSFMSLHKGWLIFSLTRRLKSKHMNLYTGQIEEGSYIGAGQFIADVVKNLKKKGLKKSWLEALNNSDGGFKAQGDFSITKDGKVFKKYESKEERDEALKEIIAEQSKNRRTSVFRVAGDLVATNTLIALALIMKNIADDDDEDSYFKQFGSYMTYRLATEVTSQSTGIPSQIYGFLESPTAGLAQLQNIMDIGDLTSSEVKKNGKFRGLTDREAWIYKSLPLFKEYYKVSNMDRTRKDFEFFNKKALMFSPIGFAALE